MTSELRMLVSMYVGQIGEMWPGDGGGVQAGAALRFARGDAASLGRGASASKGPCACGPYGGATDFVGVGDIVATAAGSGAGAAVGNAGGADVALGVATLWRGELQLIWVARHSSNRIVAVIAFVIGVILYWAGTSADNGSVAAVVGVGAGMDVGVSVGVAVGGGFCCCRVIVSPPIRLTSQAINAILRAKPWQRYSNTLRPQPRYADVTPASVRAGRRICLGPHRAGASAATTAAASAGAGYRARLAVCARGEGGEHGELAPRFAAAVGAGGGRVHLAHRAALLKAVGAGYAGVFVYRHCNNLACCPLAYRAYRVSGGTAARRRCRDAPPPALRPF